MPKTTLQIPPELDGRIQAIADRERRSKHQQMLVLLEGAVEYDERMHPQREEAQQ